MDAGDRYLFEPIGITPPRGRLGHSVPTPKPLGNSILVKPTAVANGAVAMENGKLTSWKNTDLHRASTQLNKASPAQFYLHREHTFGGSMSKLDRVRPLHSDFSHLEPFDETVEEDEEGELESVDGGSGGGDVDSGRPVSRQSRLSSDLGHSTTSMGSTTGNHGRLVTLDKFTGDSMLHYSYSALGGGAGIGLPSDNQLGGSFVRAFSQGLNSSLNVPFVQQNSSSSLAGGGESSVLFPSAARNPNKSIVTIDAQTSRILMANEMTCELFGYQRNELVNMKVQSLFTEPYRAKQRALVEQNVDSSGEPVLISGKVMDAVTSYGVEFPVSVWMKRLGVASSSSALNSTLPATPRVIIVIEPVERSSAVFTIDQKGTLVSCDPWFACLFGFTDAQEIVGLSLFNFLPSLNLPKSTEELAKFPSKQAVTGRANDGTVFPTTVKFTDVSQNLSIGDLYSPTASSQDELEMERIVGPAPANQHDSAATASMRTLSSSDGESPGMIGMQSSTPNEKPPPSTANEGSSTENFTINAKLIVYAALSGMISFLPDGTIHGCNHHFALMLFGYTQQELQKKDITFLIPEFYNHVNYVDDHGIPLPPLDEEEVFHPVSERSFSPERMQEALRQAGRNDPRIPLSPARQKNMLYQPSPVKRALHHQLKDTTTTPQDDVTPHHSSNDVRFSLDKATLSSVATVESNNYLSNEGSSTTCSSSEGITPSLSQINTQTSAPLQQQQQQQHKFSTSSIEEQDKLLSLLSEQEDIQDPLKWITAMSETAEQSSDRVLANCATSSLSDPTHLPPVPSRLVPSQSTERIMEILKQRGLTVDNSNHSSNDEQKAKLPSSSSITKIEEESQTTTTTSGVCDVDELSSGSRNDVLSSTPATKSSGDLRRASDNLFMVGSGLLGQDFDRGSVNSVSSLPEGTFFGDARHKDGSLMAIIFQLKCVTLADGKSIFCMWISRDLDCERARTADLSMSMSKPPDPYRHDQIISPDVGLGGGGDHTHLHRQQEEVLAMEGEYSNSYTTLTPIGKGAFGFVRLAQHKNEGTMVVVKFLRKSSVLKDCWVQDVEMGLVPLEISLLARLTHPNIVQLLEAYENEFFFQMVMEKHGDGLDLFEFIEKNPRLNEQIVSYMFRQIVSALSYLHERNILHRDIKDENIIIDRQFTLKLIDFGSAAYMEEGKLFHTFCGTLEYCSPEVLLGNSYTGPELEMWALGVTLYTVVFGENPFFDVEETISGHLQPPFLTSPGLMKVLLWLLHPDPRSRATLKDLQRDKWTNQPVDISQYSFEAILGYTTSGGPGGAEEEEGPEPSAVQHHSHHHPPHIVKHNSDGDTQRLERALEQLLCVKEEGVP